MKRIVLVVTLALAGCGTSSGETCIPGSEGCECNAGVCLTGLVCLSDLCVDPGTGGTGGTGGAGGDGPPEPAVVSIAEGSSRPGCEETDMCYVPTSLTVEAGTEVLWNNDDSEFHTVTSGIPESGSDGSFDSGPLMTGASFNVVFDTPGQFPYFCMLHPWMQAMVTVE